MFDSEAHKFHESILDEAIVKQVRHLAKSIQVLSYGLIGGLNSGSDMAEELLFIHGELDRLSSMAESVSVDLLAAEQAKKAGEA